MITPEQNRCLHFLVDCGYSNIKFFGDERWGATLRFMFTSAILSGSIYDRVGHDNRWCYSTMDQAQAALEAWDGEGEPDGWHRHPSSGRRRPDGNVAQEYINL